MIPVTAKIYFTTNSGNQVQVYDDQGALSAFVGRSARQISPDLG